MQRPNLPLSGVRVVDFGQYIAGPAAAMVLADLGATVVHVDPPSGPLWESPANATLNRNKLIVSIDLDTDEGLSQAKSLVAQADIVIENFRPGVLRRLGIDFAALRKDRPELITVSIPGFASNDELRREWRAFEAVIAASSGVFTDMGLDRVLMGFTPYFSPLPLASAYGTMIAASAAVLALQARERSGVGDEIEIPLACAVMEPLAYNSCLVENTPARYSNYRSREIARRHQANLPMDLSYQAVQDLHDPFYRNTGYICKDGRVFSIACCAHKHHVRRCLEALGLYDGFLAEGLVEEEDRYRPKAEWRSDVCLSAPPLPWSWHEKITRRMKSAFLTRTSEEWEQIFREKRISGSPQRSLKEWMSSDHARQSGLVVGVDDPVYGQMVQPGPVTWLEESGQAMLEPAPRRWIAVDEAIAALSAMPLKRLPGRRTEAASGWLDGVRVVDLSNVIAGPHAAYYLARFGAEVIKVDPTEPLYDCSWTVFMGMVNLAGKSSTLVDIGRPTGREVLNRLVKSADVIIWNATESQVKRIGLDLEGLRAINPEAIFCQVDCLSGPRRGPSSDNPGYDDIAQAATGIMLRFGGSPETPEEHAHNGTIDALGAFSSALGVAAALYQKAVTGRVGRARTSLCAASGLLQVPFFYDYEGRGPFDEPAGPEAEGYSPLARLYLTASGETLMLNALESDLLRLAQVEGLEGIAETPAEDRTAFLSTAIAKVGGETWVSRLNAANIGAAICENISTLRSENCRLANGKPGIDRGSYAFSRYPDHPSGYCVTQLDPYAVRPQVGKVYGLRPAEKYGASTRWVLERLKYSEAEIDSLLISGAIAEGWSREYLPS